MKVSCDIIRDILPLYAEDMVSDATRDMVDEHLCGCDECTKELGALKKAAKVPVEAEPVALKKVQKAIHQRRILSVLTALLLVFTVFCSLGLLMDAKIYLTAEQAVESVEALEDGSIRVRWSTLVVGTGSLGYENTESEESNGNYGIIANTRLSKLLSPTDRLPYEEMPEDVKEIMTEEEYNARWGTSTYQLEGGAVTCNFWYCSAKDGRADTLLWDAGNPEPVESFADVNYHLAYYCGLLAVLVVILKVFANLWNAKLVGKIAGFLDALFSCVLISTLIVSACQFMELWGEFTENFVEGWVLSIPMFAMTLCAIKLRDLNMIDKAI